MIEFIDLQAERASNHYHSFLLSLVGAWAAVLDEPAPTTPAARGHFATAAQSTQINLLTGLASQIDQASSDIVKEAVRDANPALGAPQQDVVFGIIKEARSDLIQQIMLASDKDIATVSKSLRELALNVDTLMNARGSSYTSALYAVKSSMGGDFRFSQLDSLGRKWASTTYLHALTRGFMVTSFIDTELYALSAKGVDLVSVKHPEENHPHAGMMFSISGTIPNVPAYQDIKHEVWHPNSRALVSHP